MVDGDNSRAGGASGKRKGDAARAERLRRALRENLKRRKSQAKERSKGLPASGTEAGRGPAHDSAGFVPDKQGK